MAEQMRRHSPYNYGFDNPVRFVDPDGMVSKEWGALWLMRAFAGTSEEEQSEALWEDGDDKDKGKKKEENTSPVVDALVDLVPGSRMGNLAGQEFGEGNILTGTAYLLGGTLEAGLETFSYYTGGALASKMLPKLGRYLTGRFAARTSNRILNTTTRQLQAKFKHAADFGVTGNWNKAAAGRFNSAINQHINSAGVKTINGTYRGQSVIHIVNPNTGLNVISSPSGQFISGWKLNPTQLQNVLKHGGL